jgi:hypothetical protein
MYLITIQYFLFVFSDRQPTPQASAQSRFAPPVARGPANRIEPNQNKPVFKAAPQPVRAPVFERAQEKTSSFVVPQASRSNSNSISAISYPKTDPATSSDGK